MCISIVMVNYPSRIHGLVGDFDLERENVRKGLPVEMGGGVTMQN